MRSPKKKMIMVAAGVLLLAMVPGAALAVDDTLTGTFRVNNPPSITAVTFVPTSMTPQTACTVTVGVSDADGKADLNTLVLKVYYDADGGVPLVTEHDSQSANTQTCAVITWTQASDTFAIQPAASTTWSLGACSSPGSLPGNFTFAFTPGKVATATTGAAKWQITAKVTDDQSSTAFGYDAEAADMNFYGEVAVAPTGVDWGTLTPGVDFGVSTKQSISSVVYIANGNFDKKVKSAGTWTGGSNNATLDATGVCSSAQQFALKADDTATLGSAVLVDTAGVIIDNTGTQTTEAGVEVTTNNLWLKLASTFNSDTYSGVITYMTANR